MGVLVQHPLLWLNPRSHGSFLSKLLIPGNYLLEEVRLARLRRVHGRLRSPRAGSSTSWLWFLEMGFCGVYRLLCPRRSRDHLSVLLASLPDQRRKAFRTIVSISHPLPPRNAV